MIRSRGLHTQGDHEDVGINCKVARSATRAHQVLWYELPPGNRNGAGRHNEAARVSGRVKGTPRATANESAVGRSAKSDRLLMRSTRTERHGRAAL